MNTYSITPDPNLAHHNAATCLNPGIQPDDVAEEEQCARIGCANWSAITRHYEALRQQERIRLAQHEAQLETLN